MKKTLFATAVVLLTALSCSKNTDGNAGIVKSESQTDNSAAATEYTDRYVAEDGSSALVTFRNTGDEKTISVSRDKIIINAAQKEGEEGVYADHDYEIVAKNDSVTITQGNNVILLKKARTNTP